MKTITVAGQKGGAGKTTIAVHLAAAASGAGLRVAIIDADPQGSASAWAAARPATAAPIPVAPLIGRDVLGGIEAAKVDGFDLVIVDTPPHASAAAAPALSVADVVLVPVRPSVLDLAALPAALALVDAAGRPSVLVLSAIPSRCAEAIEVRATLEAGGRAVAESEIGDRADFRRALASGHAVAETAPRSAAAREIRALWREIGAKIGFKMEVNNEQ